MAHVYRLLALALLITPCLTAAAQQSMTVAEVAAELSTIQATDIYMKIDDIKGESQQKDHEDWIDVLSINHAMVAEISSGGGGGRTAGVPRHEPVRLTKRLDMSSPVLMHRMNTGHNNRDVEIEFVLAGQQPYTYLKYELQNVYITSYSTSGASDDRPTEEIAFAYEKIIMTYWPQQQDGSQGEPVIFSWNVSTNTTKTAQMEQIDYYVDGQDVLFRWETPMQDGNYGFEVQHLEQDGFKRAAYIPGAGWTDERLSYEVRISGLSQGIHVFRLAALGFGNNVEYSHEMRVSLGVEEGLAVALEEPYPNPFTTTTTLAVSVAEEGLGRISVFDVLGREVALVYEGTLEPGAKREFVFAPADALPVGLYFVRAKTDGGVQTRAVTVVR